MISATNLVEGGGLQVLRDCVEAASRLSDKIETIVLAHDRNLLSGYGVAVMEVPDAKKSWWRRVNVEYRKFRSISEELRPDVWLSLHDMTPNVQVPEQFVYCHNPAPFYRISLGQIWRDPKFAAFNLFYHYLYSINIRKNKAIIVQQDWLRREFIRRFGVKHVITAAPTLNDKTAPRAIAKKPAKVFLYPAFPRVFKNFEILCHAVRRLSSISDWAAEVRFTIDGDENRYARWIAKLSADLPGIKLIGRQTRAEMERQYAQADALLFPSTLETWGLPIAEAKQRGMPIMLADLPYAHETLGLYQGACFLDPSDESKWADAMKCASEGLYKFDVVTPGEVRAPDIASWDSLLLSLCGSDSLASAGTA